MHPFHWMFTLAMLLLKEVTMRLAHVFVAFAALIAPPSVLVHAQAAPDATGHWEGSAQIPDGTVSIFEIDLVKDADGRLAGTISMPAEQIVGLPLITATLDGSTLTLVARTDQPMAGTLSADGNDVSGDLTLENFRLPFRMTRTGGAQIAPQPRNAAVDPTLEGRWNATLTTPRESVRVALTVANRADGTATAFIENLDEGGLRIPAATIAQNGAHLSFALDAIHGSFDGEVSADGNQIVGTYSADGRSAPLAFVRAR